MNSLLYTPLLAGSANPSDDHPIIDTMIEILGNIGESFGTVADGLYGLVGENYSSSALATAMEGIASGLLVFFMLLEIVSYCFNIDFHAGLESAMKIGVKTVLMFIIVDNSPKAAKLVMSIFTMDDSLNFTDTFQTITQPFDSITATLPSGGWIGIAAPILFGTVLVGIILFTIYVMTMMIMSMIGILAETAILTVVSPVACSTLVNSQLRQTGITFLKNLAAITMQWGVIALCFDVYGKLCSLITFENLIPQNSVIDDGQALLSNAVSTLAPILCLLALNVMISKSGEITKRALGV